MNDNYVVIKEKQLRMLMAQLNMSPTERNEAIEANTIPAQQLWDAAQKQNICGIMSEFTYPTMNDFLTEKFDK